MGCHVNACKAATAVIIDAMASNPLPDLRRNHGHDTRPTGHESDGSEQHPGTISPNGGIDFPTVPMPSSSTSVCWRWDAM